MMLVLYGPTVTGKTALAVKLARLYNGELISADSRQAYKSLEIGAGKIAPNCKVNKFNDYWVVDGVKIRGYDTANTGSRWSAANFIAFADKSLKEIQKKDKTPIVVGGTGFYIKSFLDGLDTYGIKPNLKLRKKLENFSVDQLQKELKKINPKRAATLNISDVNNPRRLIRAIEISSANPKKAKNAKEFKQKYLIYGLTAPNGFLFKKADEWLETRLNLGLIDEIKNLLKDVDRNWLISLGLEYKWITEAVSGHISLEYALLRLKGDIHALIRRQKTFFKQFNDIRIFDVTEKNWENKLQNSIDQCYTQINGRQQFSTKN